MWVYVHVCLYIYMCIYIYVCVCVCMWVYIHVCIYMCVCVFIYIHVYVYCVYIYIYIECVYIFFINNTLHYKITRQVPVFLLLSYITLLRIYEYLLYSKTVLQTALLIG